MGLPFSMEQFYGVFAAYNEAVWPAQLALTWLGLLAAGFAILRPSASRIVTWILAALWAWTGIAYHFFFFTAINPAAWFFGAMCLVASFVFGKHAAAGTLRFEWHGELRGWFGVGLVVYAILLYPLIGAIIGHHYPHAPTFGAPCPTTILTLGVLMLGAPPLPRSAFVVPIAWALVGSLAAVQLGVLQDVGLLVAAAAAIADLVATSSRGAPSHP